MPMLHIGWALHHVSLFDSLSWLPFDLMVAYTTGYNQDLPCRMAVPIASGTGFKEDITYKGSIG